MSTPASSGSPATGSNRPVSFAQYNFDADPRWANYLRNFECPSNLTEQEFQYRIKRKFYQQFVEVGQSGEAPSSPPTNSASGASTTSPPRSSSTIPPRPPPSASGASTPPPAGTPPASLFDLSFTRLPEKIWLATGLSITIHGLLCMLPFFFSFETNMSIFRRFLLSAIINYGISLYHLHGLPQFNMAFLQRLMMDPNAQYFFVCLLFLTALPNPLFAFGVTVASGYHIMAYLTPSLQQVRPDLAAQFNTIQQQYSHRLWTMCSYCEFFVIFLLILQAFYGGGILIIFGYFQFLTFRYLTNSYSRAAFTEIGEKADGIFFHPSSPTILRSGYTKVKELLTSWVQHRQGPQPPQ
eukprot:TRINITY_DN7717_c0_g1_i1.p1 TRINITY_DN7717_c0_g1~~TRINITY_DN7717_c0_g1_i1.p1  ORF type:complete len:353 (+),score=65.70 TRINITY_DN7717_c0_g1_i1:38-1096(+)